MLCSHCGEDLPEEIHDTTYCNYNSPRYSEGTQEELSEAMKQENYIPTFEKAVGAFEYSRLLY